MAFTVQDDTGTVAGANAYIDVAFFTSYHQERGNVIPSDQTVIQQKIILATEHLDLGYEARVPGARLTGYDQTTAFPRKGLYRDDGVTPITGLPRELKRACAELALLAVSGPLTKDQLPTDQDPSAVTYARSKVGEIEDEKHFSRSAVRAAVRSPKVGSLMRPLLAAAPRGTFR